MSIGFRQEELSDASITDLYTSLGDRDTPRLFEKKYKVDTDHDIPQGAGNSVDRKTIYIDRILYQEVMDGAFAKTNLEPEQIVRLWCEHEHIEKCIVDGDNEVDNYYPSHTRALVAEHKLLAIILGPSIKVRENYEEVIWPGLVRVYHRPIRKVPKDLWCAPLLDDPTPRDEEILEQMVRLGVLDANKRTKHETHYQAGPTYCKDCSMWAPHIISQEHGALATCTAVNGLVRDIRHCDLWMSNEQGKNAKSGQNQVRDVDAEAA